MISKNMRFLPGDYFLCFVRFVTVAGMLSTILGCSKSYELIYQNPCNCISAFEIVGKWEVTGYFVECEDLQDTISTNCSISTTPGQINWEEKSSNTFEFMQDGTFVMESANVPGYIVSTGRYKINGTGSTVQLPSRTYDKVFNKNYWAWEFTSTSSQHVALTFNSSELDSSIRSKRYRIHLRFLSK